MYSQPISLMQRGRPADAMKLLVQMQPHRQHDPDYWVNCALCHEDLADIRRAERIYQMLLERWPKHLEALSNYGNLLIRLGRVDEAYASHAAALDLKRDPYSLRAMALTLIEQLRIEEAIPLLREAAHLRQDAESASEVLSYSLHVSPSPPSLVTGHLPAPPASLVTGHLSFAEAPAFASDKGQVTNDAAQRPANDKGQVTNDAAALAEAHRRFLGRFAAAALHRPPESSWDGQRAIRVGFVGDCFRQCATAAVLEPLIEQLDPAKIEHFIYSDVRKPDATTKRFWEDMAGPMRAPDERWRDTAGLRDDQLSGLIVTDEIDIVVDLMGHKPRNRLSALARHPAPVLLSYIGYAGDTGFTHNIDREVGWAYRPDPEAPPIAAAPAESNPRDPLFTFGSIARPAKITTDTMRLWAWVMDAVPNSRFLLAVNGGEGNIVARHRLEFCGLDPKRLVLVDRPRNRRDYLALADGIDLALDTFPYNGGATTFELLWQGVPTLTIDCPEPMMGARIMNAVAMDGCIARDPENFVKLAIHWADRTGRDGLALFRNIARAKLNSLIDGRRSARAFEDCCARMLRNARAREPASALAERCCE